MAVRSKRKAREAALQALYEIEVGRMPIGAVLRDTLEFADLPEDFAQYARDLVTGVRDNQASIDGRLAAAITDWDLDRIAAVDRNVLRIAAFELYHLPAIPPAVTLNEAIDISKKYSTAESGKFVNGVLGRLLADSPKANWDPATAPPEEREEIVRELEPQPEEETIEADSEEAQRLARVGGWKFKSSK